MSDSPQLIALTSSAESKLAEVIRNEENKYLRVDVLEKGPTGFMYDLGLADKYDETSDYIYPYPNFSIVVNKKVANIVLKGTVIDFWTNERGETGFQFNNPNAVAIEGESKGLGFLARIKAALRSIFSSS